MVQGVPATLTTNLPQASALPPAAQAAAQHQTIVLSGPITSTSDVSTPRSFRDELMQQPGARQKIDSECATNLNVLQSIVPTGLVAHRALPSAPNTTKAQNQNAQSGKAAKTKASSTNANSETATDSDSDATGNAKIAAASAGYDAATPQGVLVATIAIGAATPVNAGDGRSSNAKDSLAPVASKTVAANDVSATNPSLPTGAVKDTSMTETNTAASEAVNCAADIKAAPLALPSATSNLPVFAIGTPAIQAPAIAHANHTPFVSAATVSSASNPQENLMLRSYDSPTHNQLEVGLAGPDGALRIRAEMTAGGEIHTMLRAGSPKLESELQLQTATMSAYLSAEGVVVKSIQVEPLRGSVNDATGFDTNSNETNGRTGSQHEDSQQQDSQQAPSQFGSGNESAVTSASRSASLANFFSFNYGENVSRSGLNGMGGWLSVMA